METSVLANLQQIILDCLDVLRLAIRSKPHDFVLATVNFESGVVGESAVEKTKTVRVTKLFEQRQFRCLADSDRTGGPLAELPSMVRIAASSNGDG